MTETGHADLVLVKNNEFQAQPLTCLLCMLKPARQPFHNKRMGQLLMDLLPVELNIYYCALQYAEPFLDVSTKMCLLPVICIKNEMDFFNVTKLHDHTFI